MRWIVAVFVLFLSPGLSAEVYVGPARALDGDTLEMTGTRIRLSGIDAPEVAQTCEIKGEAWECGQEARSFLAALVADQQVICKQLEKDRYGRSVAICTAGKADLGQRLVEAGLAVALPQFSEDYVVAAERAAALGIGIWGSQFELPADYRAAHPAQYSMPKQTDRMRAASMSIRSPANRRSDVYYRNCREARAAGAAPIYRGQPGYRPEMDGDNDGIACEPIRR